MEDTPFLSIIIPAYHEEQRLPRTLEILNGYLHRQTYSYELIVVDDGSSDESSRLMQQCMRQFGEQGLFLKNERNRGKGYSVRRGVLSSHGDYVLFSDADLSTPITEVEKLLGSLRQGYDIAIGSRGLKTSDIQVHQAWYRERMGKIFNRIARSLHLTKFSDTQCGFKCFRGDAARSLFPLQSLEGWSFDVEILFLAARRKYRIAEVPIQWFNEPNSRVNALTDAMKMFRDLLLIRYNAWSGKYD